MINSSREGEPDGIIDGYAGESDLALIGVATGPGDLPPGQIVKFTWTPARTGAGLERSGGASVPDNHSQRRDKRARAISVVLGATTSCET